MGSNHREAGRLATEHLPARAPLVGTVTGPFRRHVVRSRLHGYEDALRAAIEPGEDLAVEGDWTPAGAAARPGCCWSAIPQLTAIFVHSDMMAIGVLSAVSGGRQLGTATT